MKSQKSLPRLTTLVGVLLTPNKPQIGTPPLHKPKGGLSHGAWATTGPFVQAGRNVLITTGYMLYIPSKHMVVSRRDATFNQAYLPARVGETTLIRTKTMIDGAGESGTIENDTKNSSNDTKTVQNDTKTVQNDIKHSNIYPNSDLEKDKQ